MGKWWELQTIFREQLAFVNGYFIIKNEQIRRAVRAVAMQKWRTPRRLTDRKENPDGV